MVKEAVEKLMGSRKAEETLKSAANLANNIKKNRRWKAELESCLQIDSFVSYINREM